MISLVKYDEISKDPKKIDWLKTIIYYFLGFAICFLHHIRLSSFPYYYGADSHSPIKEFLFNDYSSIIKTYLVFGFLFVNFGDVFIKIYGFLLKILNRNRSSF